MTDANTDQPTVLQTLLGLFVAGQLLFLLVANGVFLVQGLLPPVDVVQADPPPPSPGRRAVQTTRELTDFWAALTLQTQTWCMFPEFPVQSTFPAVRLVWQPGNGAATPMVVTLRAEFEPDNPYHYFSPNLLSDRRYNWVAWQERIFATRNAWATIPDEARRSDRYQALGRGWWRPLLAYMNDRLAQYRNAHPNSSPPDEVVLLFRIYDTPPPNADPWAWQGPRESVLARWRPGTPIPVGEPPLELFDPVTGQFIPIRPPT